MKSFKSFNRSCIATYALIHSHTHAHRRTHLFLKPKTYTSGTLSHTTTSNSLVGSFHKYFDHDYLKFLIMLEPICIRFQLKNKQETRRWPAPGSNEAHSVFMSLAFFWWNTTNNNNSNNNNEYQNPIISKLIFIGWFIGRCHMGRARLRQRTGYSFSEWWTKCVCESTV